MKDAMTIFVIWVTAFSVALLLVWMITTFSHEPKPTGCAIEIVDGHTVERHPVACEWAQRVLKG